MFITNHVLAGTIAGTALRRRPVLAFCVGVATHVAMDITPHWGDATLERDGFVAVAKRVTAAGVPPRTALLAGIAGAALLDADKPCEYFFGFNPWPQWLDRFHREIQHESPEGMRTEVAAGIALAALSVAVLARRRRLATRG